MPKYQIHTAMAGMFLPEGDTAPEVFEATPEMTIAMLLDEAEEQLGDEPDWDDEVLASDRAFVESLRGAEGRGDLLHALSTSGSVAVGLESWSNGFGGIVMLYEAAYWVE